MSYLEVLATVFVASGIVFNIRIWWNDLHRRQLIANIDTMRDNVAQLRGDRDALYLELGKFSDVPSFEYWKEKAEAATARIAELEIAQVKR